MPPTLDRQLRRHRRTVLWALAIFAVASIALSSATALMSAHDHDDVSDIVAVCMTMGVCTAAAGVALLAVRRRLQRPLWLVAAPLLPALPVVPASAGFLTRAGPASPSLLQVFRL